MVVQTLSEVLALVGPSRAQRIQVRNGRFELDVTLRPEPGGNPAAAETGTSADSAKTDSSADAAPVDCPAPDTIPVTAPAIGVFHRCPAPGKPPFVEVGDRAAAGDELGLVEAMKVFTPVVADRAGTVSAIHVADRQLVEYGQPLVDLLPDPADEPPTGRRTA
ncbi:acetyl-CoA carboxylase biotin carboxyl carrier protein [Actinosynnema sp. CS-041913]|uniref:acetyl-CoA carboxylase biotin carboxyl carrier protein n=1 Tax=Actinosynnema sp. CS-041913 TaxID=3239917 RepID=UPI003D9371FA